MLLTDTYLTTYNSTQEHINCKNKTTGFSALKIISTIAHVPDVLLLWSIASVSTCFAVMRGGYLVVSLIVDKCLPATLQLAQQLCSTFV